MAAKASKQVKDDAKSSPTDPVVKTPSSSSISQHPVVESTGEDAMTTSQLQLSFPGALLLRADFLMVAETLLYY